MGSLSASAARPRLGKDFILLKPLIHSDVRRMSRWFIKEPIDHYIEVSILRNEGKI